MASRRPRYNEQFFRGWGRPGPLAVGLVIIILIAIGFYFAFAKSVPFTGNGYEVKATFTNAVNIAVKSPVRIAGVNVGKVTDVEGDGDNTTVTFTVDDEGRPIHDDASAQIRPRLFLEGNFFIDLDPGTPDAKEMDDGGTIPVTRTATSVQIDQVLTSLQSPERANLQRLLSALGTGLNRKPTPAQDATFAGSVKGLSGGEALNEAFRYGKTAARGTAIVSEAFLGQTPHDIGNLLRGLSRVSKTLDQRQDDLTGFVDNLDTTTGALASESGNLSETIARLGPTLRTARSSLTSLNSSLPALRGFAIAIRPGIAEIPRTIKVARPWTRQAKPLLTSRELGGLAKVLQESTPNTARSVASTIKLLPQLRDFGLCVSGNLVPTGDQVIEDGASSTGQKASREFLYAAANMAGEAQNFDGNGPFLRFLPGGGSVSVKTTDPGVSLPDQKTLYGTTFVNPEGTRPAAGSLPPLKSDVACHTQDVPDLNGPAAAAGPPNPTVYSP